MIDEAEYQIVKYIMDQYDLEHLDPTAIARKCNDLGYRTRRGNLMERRSIERVLRNPFYAGTVVWNGISFDGTHETRLDPARYQDRIKRMDARRRSPKSRNPSTCRHWLSGLLKCPICGATMTVTAGSTSCPYFQCWKYAKASTRVPTQSRLPRLSEPSTVTSMISLPARTSLSASGTESRSKKTMKPSSDCNRL